MRSLAPKQPKKPSKPRKPRKEIEWTFIRTPTEWDEQRTLCEWLCRQHPKLVFFSVPNEGNRSDPAKFRMHQTGMLSGAPDLVLLTYPKPLFIEMKRSVKGKLSEKQIMVHDWIRKTGFEVLVCYGFLDAKKQLEDRL